MHARYYSNALGRFISSDSVIPNAAYPQALNRYSYAINSPLNYRDPSGHVYDDWKDCSTSAGKADCWKYNAEKNILEGAGVTWDVLNETSQNTAGLLAALAKGFGIGFRGKFSWSEAGMLTQAIAHVSYAFGQSLGQMDNAAKIFAAVFSSGSGTVFDRAEGAVSPFGSDAIAWGRNIAMWDGQFPDWGVNGIIHEMGHMFNWKVLGGWNPWDNLLTDRGFPSNLADSIDGFSIKSGYSPLYGAATPPFASERFADMFLGYVVGGFNLIAQPNDPGSARFVFMQTHMRDWLKQFYP